MTISAPTMREKISTGMRGLDDLITGLRLGDNVVWQVDDIADYAAFVKPFVRRALDTGKKVVYIRFAAHREILTPSRKIKRYELNAYAGFESFATKVFRIISQEGEGAYYVFDCLSELLRAWATDLMLGNFFMVTCPYLYELKTIAYFALLRNNHSFKSIARIRETTQLLIDIYRCEGKCYIHPLKVWNRYTPTMFLPHQRKKDAFTPVTDSVNAAKILSYIHKKGVEGAKRNLDHWDRLFLEAEELTRQGATQEQKRAMVRKLCGIMISKSKRVLALVARRFSLEEFIEIKSRLIGTGFVGGKTVGMLLARKILSEDKALGWQGLCEPHDSFYVGSDIFYSYIVQNHWWKARMQQKTPEGYFTCADALREKMLHGTFPDEIREYFQQIIEYFGASPIIVRSSSLLEDGFGNAFAGKYESIFLANQGTPDQRYARFAEAVRRVYASAMSEDALVYRRQRGLDKQDEQMALLVQRVSGARHKHTFFPDCAGVGVSRNIYVWNAEMDPEAGMLRLVAGLGTRAVNRVEGDYPRMVALDNPLQRPTADKEDVRKYAQHDVDLIDTRKNAFSTVPFNTLIREKAYTDPGRLAVKDDEAERLLSARGLKDEGHWVLTLDGVLRDSAFTGAFRRILKTLQKNYDYPVEIEFTVNFTKDDTFKINLLQCRPLQTRGAGRRVEIPDNLDKGEVLFESQGSFMGGNVSQKIARVVTIDPERYAALTLSEKYDVARIAGDLNRDIPDAQTLPCLFMAPGRWGTTTPSLGVSVRFAEINKVAALVEVGFAAGDLVPELSFGTHFFQDLVETGIFYAALFPEKSGVVFNRGWFARSKDIFPELMPGRAKYKDVIAVYDTAGRGLKIMSDVVSQRVVCFSGKAPAGAPASGR